MTVQLHRWILPAAITLFCISVVIQKLMGESLNLVDFISGVLFGVAALAFVTYAVVASREGVIP
jgi:hypothetical protein